jgi:hypothetical protein
MGWECGWDGGAMGCTRNINGEAFSQETIRKTEEIFFIIIIINLN